MRKIVCIFPQDKSTDFLLPIYERLERLSGFKGYRFDTMISQQAKDLYEPTNFEKGTLLVFLGHGTSKNLYGSVDETGEKQELFNRGNIDHIRNLDFICIACRSKEFAHNHFQNYIGFGDITSDFSEVIAERNLYNPNFMDWASENDIINFQKVFVQAISNAILSLSCTNLYTLYKMIRLCLNKQITELLKNKSLNNYRYIADMLFDVLQDMTCCLNSKLV